MRRIPALSWLLLSAACGGGGGGESPVQGSTLSGRLTLVSSQPMLAQRPRETVGGEQRLATARLASTAPEGVVQRDRPAVFRYVAERRSTLAARVSGDVEVVLFDLSRGRAGRTLELDEGAVYDVIVSGRGPFLVELFEGESDQTPVALPEGYLRIGDGQAPGEIVALPADGVSPARLAEILDADWVAGDASGVLLRLRGEPRPDAVSELCRVLCCCTRAQSDGFVRLAEPNYYRRLSQNANDALVGQQWGLEQTRVLAAWTLATGATTGPIHVGVVDSGARPDHPDMAGRFEAGYDFVDDDEDPLDPTPNLAHGTSTASIISAATNNGLGIAGVHWNARIIPVRSFDTSGFGTSFRIAQGIRYAAGLDNTSQMLPAVPARILNLSFAADIRSAMEESACDDARAAGVLLIAAVGNQGRTTPHYPAAYGSVLGVGATARDGSSPSYSNRGTFVDIAAPGGTVGDGILVAGRTPGGALDYLSPSGTSFAAPHVAGVAALLLSVRPGLTVAELESLLLTTAQDIGPAGYDARSGHGIVDAFAALTAALGDTPPLLIPGEKLNVRLVQVSTGFVLFKTTTTQSAGLFWSIPGIPTDEYRLEAGTDRDFDGMVDDSGEVSGTFSGGDPFMVSGSRAGLDFAIAPR